ncbi:MAG TPA: protein phosphatase CheZ [Methylophilus sp.]|nr:protein phosphatase CheZ [Methylophilus sp.]HQQ32404.1 protein phosphatase CheZ [Methylophilus sp.]
MGIPSDDGEMLSRIGHMTRGLHESLRALGLDKMIEKAAQDIPDARDRLSYVARMTEQAADRVLNATDIANPLQDELAKQAAALEAKWKEVLKVPSLKSEYNEAAEETLAFIRQTVETSTATKAQLLEIMMAQDFQDLTGQVIKKITRLAQDLEQQLVQLLVDFSPAPNKKEADSSLLNGPQINPEENVNVVANQSQVDDLLESLGF